MVNLNPYKDYKKITDRIYSGEITMAEAKTQVVEFLTQNGIGLRSGVNKVLGYSFFVYDKGEYFETKEKPLGLGVIYLKQDGTKTQDIFMIHPNKPVEKYYKEELLVKKYPWMKNVHKKELPL